MHSLKHCYTPDEGRTRRRIIGEGTKGGGVGGSGVIYMLTIWGGNETKNTGEINRQILCLVGTSSRLKSLYRQHNDDNSLYRQRNDDNSVDRQHNDDNSLYRQHNDDNSLYRQHNDDNSLYWQHNDDKY